MEMNDRLLRGVYACVSIIAITKIVSPYCVKAYVPPQVIWTIILRKLHVWHILASMIVLQLHHQKGMQIVTIKKVC